MAGGSLKGGSRKGGNLEGGSLKTRGRHLEETFFNKESDKLLEQLRLQHEEQEALDALASASSITDPDLLGRLAAIGIRAETLAALTLVPLVEVAWADGVMEAPEREAILRGAASSGIAEDSCSYGLLAIWTEDRPPPEMMDSWCEYMRALCAELSPDQRRHLENEVLGRARAVAEAAGGFLGLGSKISRVEEGVLAKMESVFIG